MQTNNPEKITACYCRVSTEMQKEKESIEAQRSRLEVYCRENGYNPTFYLDDGYSAKDTAAR
jgi:DNA invertase Pin-like site-specific DNA recombinase